MLEIYWGAKISIIYLSSEYLLKNWLIKTNIQISTNKYSEKIQNLDFSWIDVCNFFLFSALKF